MLFGGRKMKHKKQKKTKKAGRILLAVFAVVIGTLGVLLFTSERWMRKTWPNEHGRACLPVKGPDCRNQP